MTAVSPLCVPPKWESWDQLMELALEEAQIARTLQEVPVGAVLVDEHGALLARGHNQIRTQNDPTAHAEILCLRQASAALGNYRLMNTSLVVTLEPCLMCVGALVHARVGSVVFGASDEKTGAVLSRLQGFSLDFHNHSVNVFSGVLAAPCSQILSRFFQKRRKQNKRGLIPLD